MHWRKSMSVNEVNIKETTIILINKYPATPKQIKGYTELIFSYIGFKTYIQGTQYWSHIVLYDNTIEIEYRSNHRENMSSPKFPRWG